MSLEWNEVLTMMEKDQINCSSLANVFYEERFNTRSWLLLKEFSLSLWTRKAQKSIPQDPQGQNLSAFRLQGRTPRPLVLVHRSLVPEWESLLRSRQC